MLPALIPALVVLCGVLLVALALQIFVAHRIPELTESSLAAAEKKWSDHGPASYEMDLKLGGVRPGTVHVEVVGGEVTAMQRDGVTPKQQRTWAVWSVPGQFETIERELELAADPEHEMQVKSGTQVRLRCEFDPQYGYPRVYHRMITGGGPEVYWQVTSFKTPTHATQ
jgi:Family of unknown function (DUF6174)